MSIRKRACTIIELLIVIAVSMFCSRAFADGEALIFGGPGTGNGTFSAYCHGIGTDSSGNIYVLDGGKVNAAGQITAGNFLVQKFNAAGTFLSQFSVYQPSLGANNTPDRMAVDPSGNVYIQYTQANQVGKFTNGLLVTTYPVSTSQATLYNDNGNYYENAGGIYYRNLSGTPYLFVMQNNGTTVSKINLSNGTSSTITLSHPLTWVADLTVSTTGALYILGADAACSGVSCMVQSYSATGTWICGYGSGTYSMMSGEWTGDVAHHTLKIDSNGNLYTISPWNSANLLKYSPSAGTVSWHLGQFNGGGYYSVNGQTLYLHVDANDNLYALTTYTNDGSNGQHVSPAVMRLNTSYFTNMPTRPLKSIGLNVSVSNTATSHMSTSLSAIPYSFVIAASNRVCNNLAVYYKIYDVNKNVVGSGNFTKSTTNGVQASQALSFTPPQYGWFSVTFDVYDTSQAPQNLLTSINSFFGVTPNYSNMPAITSGNQAFSGLPLARLDSNDANLSTNVTSCINAGLTVIVQFSSSADCTQTHVQSVVNACQSRVYYYEVVNEPNLSMGASTYKPILQNTYGWIKAIDPSAMVLGPATCGVDYNWISSFYAAGGKNYFDILTVHDYEGNNSIDQGHWEWVFGQLKSVMSAYGDGSKPIWQTEHGILGITCGNFSGICQAVRETLHRDLLESLGVSELHDLYYYVDNIGFGGFPSYMVSATGPHPAALALRTRYALLQGTLPTSKFDFGPTGNKLFFGQSYTVSGVNIATLRNLGTDGPLPLTLNVSSGSTLTVIDAFGNQTAPAVSGGKVTLNLTEFPVYVRLASGQSISVPTIDYGTNFAANATFTYTSSSYGPMSLLNDGVLQNNQLSSPSNGYWSGSLPSMPQTLEINLAASQRVNTLLIYSARADNYYSTLMNFDVTYWNGASWVTAQTVTTTCPPSDAVNMFDNYAQTWYMDQCINYVTFTPVTTTKLRINVTGTTYGVCPDATAVAAMQKTGQSPNGQALHLREVEVYGVGCGAPTFSPAAGYYSSGQTVAISTSTSGATIRYTTDGTTPTQTNGTVYSTPVAINASCTLKAIAYKSGMIDSQITSGAYYINTCQPPTFSPVAGAYLTAQNVTISSATGGVTIRYTTDGSTPTPTNGTVYSASVAINASCTLKAIAYKSGMSDSPVTSGDYTIGTVQVTVPNGTFTLPPVSTYSSGAIPTYWSLYTGFGGNSQYGGMINCVQWGTPQPASGINQFVYFYNNSYISQTLTQTFQTGVTYTMSCLFYGDSANKYFMQFSNGTPVGTAATGFTSTSWTLKTCSYTATADDNGRPITLIVGTNQCGGNAVCASSVTLTASYSQCAAPTFNPVAGQYASGQNVTISTTTGGATIRYTTDGTTPTHTNGTVYNTSVAINASCTLKAIAYKSGMNDSTVTSGDYTIGTVQITVPNGTFMLPAVSTYSSGAVPTDWSLYTGFGGNSQYGGMIHYNFWNGIQEPAPGITQFVYFYNNSYISQTLSDTFQTGVTYTMSCLFYSDGTNKYFMQFSNGTPVGTAATGYAPTSWGVETCSYTATADDNGKPITLIVGTNQCGGNAVGASCVTLTASGTAECAAPTFNPAPGQYASGQNVTISTTTGGATIRYTTDGTTPTQTNGTVYNTSVAINASCTLKAIAYKNGYGDSSVTSGTYTIVSSITVPNGTFMTPTVSTYSSGTVPTDWSLYTGFGGASQYGGMIHYNFWNGIQEPAPGITQFVYFYNNSYISQTLTQTFQTGVTYTMSCLFYSDGTNNYFMQFSNGTPVGTAATGYAPTSWGTKTCSYTATADDNGKPITLIVGTNQCGGNAVGASSVTLTAQ